MLSVAHLAAPDRGAAVADTSGHFQDAAALDKVEDDIRPLHMLQRAHAVRGNRSNPLAILFPGVRTLKDQQQSVYSVKLRRLEFDHE
jgi:hypothetical protein